MINIDAIERAALYRNGCPSTQQLADLEAGLLSADERKKITAHLRQCAACRADLADARRDEE